MSLATDLFDHLHSAMMKLCPRCATMKARAEFNRNRSANDGLQSYCRPCAATIAAEYNKRRGARVLTDEQKAARGEKSALQYSTDPARKRRSREIRLLADPKREWAKQAVRNARMRALKRGVPFDLDVEYVLGLCADTCPALGIKLAFRNVAARTMGGAHDSPSLDRHDGARGYVRGNVAVISRRANVIKNDASAEEVRAVLTWMDRQ